MTVRSPEVRIFLVGVGGVGVKVFHFHLCVILLTLIGDSNKKLSRCSTTNTVTLAFRPVKKKKKPLNRDKKRHLAAVAVRKTRRPRQKSVALFGDRDKFQNEGRPVSATATKKCRPLRRPLQKSIADFGDRDFGKCDKKVRTLSPKSARAVRGMVQPSIDSFRRANKRFQFSLLRTLLTRVT